MTDSTHYMLCTVWAIAAGYPDKILREYAKVFQMLLDNDKLLQDQAWDVHRVYEHDKKYFKEDTDGKVDRYR